MIKGFPTFFVVGAQKAGTTSLYNWLKQQPDISLPRIKETHFFSDDQIFKYGLKWYLEKFSFISEDFVRGEVCPEYMFFPKAAERIGRWNPKPKIVFIFRHPVERAFSQYQMNLRSGPNFESLSFFNALLAERGRMENGGLFSLTHHSYMARGEYIRQVKAFRRQLPHASVLFVKFESLVDQGEVGAKVYADICQFIGLASDPFVANRTEASNVASEPKNIWLRDFLYNPNPLKALVRKIIPIKEFRVLVSQTLDRWNQQPFKAKPDFFVPATIYKQVLIEIEKLEHLTGLSLADWKTRDFRHR